MTTGGGEEKKKTEERRPLFLQSVERMLIGRHVCAAHEKASQRERVHKVGLARATVKMLYLLVSIFECSTYATRALAIKWIAAYTLETMLRLSVTAGTSAFS